MQGQAQPEAPEEGGLAVQPGAFLQNVPEFLDEIAAQLVPDAAKLPLPEGIAVGALPGFLLPLGGQVVEVQQQVIHIITPLIACISLYTLLVG